MSFKPQPPPSGLKNVLNNTSLATSTGLVLTAISGNLVECQADGLVNTTANNLDLSSGAMASAFLNAAGQSIQDECHQNAPNGIKCGEVIQTQGYDLKCKCVFHTSLPSWNSSGAIQKLQDVIQEILQLSDKKGFSSVMFPALGTGQLGYDRAEVASAMFSAVADYATKNSSSSVKSVAFVIFNKDVQTIQAFQDEVSSLCKGTNGAAATPLASGKYWTEKVKYTLETKEGITVTSIRGDITDQQVDIIVNSTTTCLSITSGSGVSSAIAKAAGSQDLEQECKKACPNGIQLGEICETSGGNLNCNHIYHSAVPQFSDSSSKQVLADLIDNCLQQAESDGFKSIAFPAIGTGEQKYPASDVADILYERIRNFSTTNPGTSVRNIRIVIYEKDQTTLKAFSDHIDKLVGQRQTKQPVMTSPRPKSRKRSARPSSAKGTSGSKVDIRVVQGDITQSATDAIVNSTTESMSTESAVSQAIAKAAGQNYLDDVKKLAANKISEVAISTGGDLSCKHVIHMVVPTTDKQNFIDANKWLRAVSMCIKTAEDNQLHSLSFPAVGTGVMHNDPQLMADVLLDAIHNYVDIWPVQHVREIRVVVFQAQFLPMYQRALAKANTPKTVGPGVTSGRQLLPAEWTAMLPHQAVISVTLSPASQEYAKVAHNFNSSLRMQRTIVRIERIQNPRLYCGFCNEEMHMKAVNGAGTKNKRKLWHGTSSDAVIDINSTGFNRSYCGKNATYYGLGVYFALEASYSDGDKYSAPDDSGQKHVYQCLVLTGETTQGTQGMKAPPTRDIGRNIKYDSAVDDVKNPKIFVVFGDQRAYPEYLITYKK